MATFFQSVWQVPFGAFSLRIDLLSAVFLFAITLLVLCAGVYGVGYMRVYAGKKPLALHVFFYTVLALVLLVIATASHVILFLGAWEIMSIVTYFLIVFNDEDAAARKAGFLYLIMAHGGTFCLMLMFLLMARTAGSMDFNVIAHAHFTPVIAGTVFLLAMIGFGVKAGFIPGHIWLPHAHPAAPSHVSALLSGVAIKTGIYGICRVVWMTGGLPEWCGYALVMTGVVSGVMGVLYALGQHELKKLLAYHSIENIGIIALGLGSGLLGQSYHDPLLAMLGFGGALLHVVNHSVFKGLLFFGAGAVIQKAHTGVLDRLGGLAKRMPVTAVLFLTGAVSICGLPLFNGFVSEFIIYFGLFHVLVHLPLQGAVVCGLAILAMALMGALALACFTKVYGTVFLGVPRSASTSAHAQDVSAWMIVPMMVLAGLCLVIGLAPQPWVRLTLAAGAAMAHAVPSGMDSVTVPLAMVTGMAVVFLALIALLAGVKRLALSGLRPAPLVPTWNCGFSSGAGDTPRLQYTASSFARPIMELAKGLLLFRRHAPSSSADFPGKAEMHSSVHDASESVFFYPLFARLTGLSKRLDINRIRYTQMYLMYIFVFLLFLLVWKLK